MKTFEQMLNAIHDRYADASERMCAAKREMLHTHAGLVKGK